MSIQQQRLEERLMVLEEENKLLKMLNKIEALDNENKMIKMEKRLEKLEKQNKQNNLTIEILKIRAYGGGCGAIRSITQGMINNDDSTSNNEKLLKGFNKYQNLVEKRETKF